MSGKFANYRYYTLVNYRYPSFIPHNYWSQNGFGIKLWNYFQFLAILSSTRIFWAFAPCASNCLSQPTISRNDFKEKTSSKE